MAANRFFMKKFLRFIVILLLVIIAGVVILGLIAPKDVSTERSVTINAPKAVVEDVMLQYKNYYIWNPFRDHDTNMSVSIIGPERQAGTKYSWNGNKQVGSGEMTTKSFKEGELQYDLHFMKPMENTATGFWRVEDAGNGQSKATWSFNTHLKFPMNAFFMVMGGMDKEFDKGLNRLKAYSEAHAKDMPATGSFDIKDIQFPGHNYATVRKTINVTDMNAMMKFFDESYQSLGKAAGNRISGPATGLFYTWDEKTKTSDMAAAFPVSGDGPVNGATMANIAPARGYEVIYTGDYSGQQRAHEALVKHLAAKGEKQSLAIEEYVKGPGDTKDSTQWVTNIIYLVQ